jgi:hypothetical protein
MTSTGFPIEHYAQLHLLTTFKVEKAKSDIKIIYADKNGNEITGINRIVLVY